MERMFRQDLTATAIKKVEKKRLKEIQSPSTTGVLEPLEHDGSLVTPPKDDPTPIAAAVVPEAK